MTPLRKRIAERLVEAQHTAAILTTFNEVDMTRGDGAARASYQDDVRRAARHQARLHVVLRQARASSRCKEFPGLNAEMRGTDIVYKKHYDFGIAVGGGKGLVVPVVRNVDQLVVRRDREGDRRARPSKAKDNKLTLDELPGGTFTHHQRRHLRLDDVDAAPQHAADRHPRHAQHRQARRSPSATQIELRPMMYLALSYDHRVVDGREAVQFLVGVKERIEAPERLVLEV